MADIDFSKLPRFSELPIKAGAPGESSWGVFGDDDEIGCLNFLTAEGIVAAARLVRTGKAFRLDTPINYANPPLFERQPVQHNLKSFRNYGFLAFDDSLDSYNTQKGAQWDGLAHVGSKQHNRFYNDTAPEEIKSGPDGRLGIHHWANKVIGRGVLIDAFKYVKEQGRSINPLASERYTLGDLQGALAAQGTALHPGTILLIRTGWMQAYRNAPESEKQSMASLRGLKAAGLDPSRELVEWFWDNRVAAVGTDCPACEPWPWDPDDPGALHYRTLALLGLPIGEQFALDDLAADCAEDRVYDFMLVSAPLNLVGGIASPPNALAIK